MDWDSWKPTRGVLRNAKPRSFIPCPEFLLADTGPLVVSSPEAYLSLRFEMRAPLHNCDNPVLLCPGCGVSIPSNVVAALRNGTGLRCDFAALGDLTFAMPEECRARKLCAALASVGRVEGELQPIWKQHDWGRLYASKPALVNIPKEHLPSLRSVVGLPLWSVDFSSQELRIAALITGQELPECDIYAMIGDNMGIPRSRVKSVINPMLHGQRKEHIWYAKEPNPNLKKDRPLVETEMARIVPKLMACLDRLRNDQSVLQRTGANLFYACMGSAMDECGIESAFLPKHDGWVFGAMEQQAYHVRDVFEREAKGMTGQHFPVALEPVY